jgi:hypothetical protein
VHPGALDAGTLPQYNSIQHSPKHVQHLIENKV